MVKKLRTVNDVLPCIPIRKMEWEVNEETGRVVILRPKFMNPVMRTVIEPFFSSKFFKIKLDDLGSVVWKNFDGETTVQRLGEILAETFGKDIEPIYERLANFIFQLQRDKFIELRCPADEA